MNILNLNDVITVIFIFAVGLLGLYIHRGNLILLLICVELLYLGVILLYLVVGANFDDVEVQVFSFLVIVTIAIESVIILGIAILLYRNTTEIDVDKLTLLNG
jgi:NADH-quinone oxidoreductase subunit K